MGNRDIFLCRDHVEGRAWLVMESVAGKISWGNDPRFQGTISRLPIESVEGHLERSVWLIFFRR